MSCDRHDLYQEHNLEVQTRYHSAQLCSLPSFAPCQLHGAVLIAVLSQRRKQRLAQLVDEARDAEHLT